MCAFMPPCLNITCCKLRSFISKILWKRSGHREISLETDKMVGNKTNINLEKNLTQTPSDLCKQRKVDIMMMKNTYSSGFISLVFFQKWCCTCKI